MRLLQVTLMLALATSAPAFAQVDTATQDPQDCLARPDQNSMTNAASETNKDPTQQKASDSDTLTGKLTPCKGVLLPPPVGDQMATPAPDEGKTPVIRPDDIEPQRAVPQ